MSNYHNYYNGIGRGVGATNSLPIQTIRDKDKNEDWKKKNMDALESIGLLQLGDNAYFKDYYDMIDGILVQSDYIDESEVLSKIMDLNDGIAIPSFVKHYDIIGIIIRRIIGQYLENKDNIRIDSVDEISDNEFLRERKRLSNEYSIELFNKEFDIALAKKGIYPQGQEFNSEEEEQQFLQMLEEEKAEIIPPDVRDKELSKNFKTQFSEWAKCTIENDDQRYFSDELRESEMRDKLTTGRFFTHFHVGFDFYKPERWSPLETFFSKDVNARYPQDGEYVGRVFFISPSDIQKRFGHLMTSEQIGKLNAIYKVASNSSVKNPSFGQQMFGQNQIVPFDNYYEYDLALQTQDALGIPMGESYVNTPDGYKTAPSWLSNLYNSNFYGYKHAHNQRNDIKVRTDLVQVTEAYWRSWKKMWFISYTTEYGFQTTDIVTDDILPEFIKEHNIKKVKNKSINDLQKEQLSDNTMYEFWVPEVWKGIKINAGSSLMGNDLYLEVNPLEYQIKGDSNVFDVKLPVSGYIGESLAKRIRPHQVGYNVCLNQVFNLLEKEIGMFFLFDINFLPSDMKDQGTTEDALYKLRDLAKDVGLVAVDTTKQNLKGANQGMNAFMSQDISFDKQIQSRITLSEYYLKKALEQVGVTPDSLGQGGAYDTATKTKVGVESTTYSLAEIFNQMSVAKRKSIELHLAVAQYCQKEYIDKDIIFRASDGSRAVIHLSDPDFPLRKAGIYPIDDPRQKKRVEEFKQTLLQTNALGSDVLMYSDLFFSDSMNEIRDIAKRAKRDSEEAVRSQREHDQTMLDKELEQKTLSEDVHRRFLAEREDKKLQNNIDVKEIDSLGRAADRNSNTEGYNRIEEAAKEATNNDFKDRDLKVKEDLTNNKIENNKESLLLKIKEYELKSKELDVRMKEADTRRYVSERKNFDSSINKN